MYFKLKHFVKSKQTTKTVFFLNKNKQIHGIDEKSYFSLHIKECTQHTIKG